MSDSTSSCDAEPSVPHLPARVEAEQTRLRLPSQLDWIHATADYLRNKAILCGACLEDRAMKLHIALIEALSNAVMHGNLEISSELKEHGDAQFAEAVAARAADPAYASRLVDVLVDYDGERCEWTITDEGPGFDVEKVTARNALDDSQIILSSGRGILMMKAFLDGVRYEAGGRRAILTLAKSASDEKRRHGRTRLQQRLRIAPMRPDGSVDWESAYEAVARNFSPEGIAILQEKLAGSSRIIIGIPQPDGETLYLPAEVRHARTLGENVVELGCRFPLEEAALAEPPEKATERADDVIEGLLERLRDLQVPPDERRTFSRLIYTERVEIRSAPDAAPVIGFARDLSRGGLAMITSVPVGLDMAQLALPQGKDSPPLRVRARIVRCNKIMGGFYDVGARFLDAE